MTISSEDRIAGPFTTNGSTTDYPFTFKVFSDADIKVVKVETSGDGLITDLVLTTDYTVDLNPNQNSTPGGTVTISPALDTGYEITVTSDVAELQPVSLRNQGGFFPSVISDALDRITILIQQLSGRMVRTLQFPLGDNTSGNLPSIASRSGNVLAFDDSGVPVAGPSTNSVATIAENEAAITSIAANIAKIIAVDNNESNINLTASQLAAIQIAAGAISMTNSSLTLVLDNNTSVEGVNYNTVEDAYNYALTVLQVGGQLNLTIAASTTITESGDIELDCARIKVNISGNTKADSIWTSSGTSDININNGTFALSKVKVDSSELIFTDCDSVYIFQSDAYWDGTGKSSIRNLAYFDRCSRVFLDTFHLEDGTTSIANCPAVIMDSARWDFTIPLVSRTVLGVFLGSKVTCIGAISRIKTTAALGSGSHGMIASSGSVITGGIVVDANIGTASSPVADSGYTTAGNLVS